MAGPSMSIVIPVFNEEAAIDTIIPAARDALEARGGEWEIVVVDNASTDATQERLAGHVERDPARVRVLRNPVNRGKGFSVRRGMLDARGDLRLICDADCAPSLASLADMEALTATAEVVAGLRNAVDSRVGRHQPLRRRAASIGFILLCRWVMSEPLRDVFCGFKLFTAPAAEEVFSRSHIDGWAFDAEALALARALGYRVVGCGIAWVNRPASRLSIPRVVLPALRELLAARRHVRSVRRTAAAGAGSGDAGRAPGEPLAAVEDVGPHA